VRPLRQAREWKGIETMMRFFGQISGLLRLAERYPAPQPPEGRAFTRQTLQIGPVRYRRCVTVQIGPSGLCVWPRPILSNYPAFLIPWDEIKRVQHTWIYISMGAMLLSIGAPEVGTVRVPMSLFRQIEPSLAARLQSA
jgi:hypothetical protein